MKWVSFFGEGSKDDRERLGGKGANLAEMTRVGLPVPPGFTITSDACRAYLPEKAFPPGLTEEIDQAMRQLERETGKGFGDARNPLFVSVRSGAAISMPGMMDTVLNLGMNTATAGGLARKTSNRRFALDARRRFIQMYSNVVKHADLARFESLLDKIKGRRGITEDRDLDEASLEEVIEGYLSLYGELTGETFPDDPREQLLGAVHAVFASWDNPRAKVYRRVNEIPEDMGTAVNIMAMVFGNMGPTSATGVLFSRNPNTGERGLYGEYLTNAQGEDVVAGIRTPRPVSEMAREIPEAYAEIEKISDMLERHYRNIQDIEFTIEEGRVFLLQTRTAKRSARAAFRVAVDMVSEGILSREEALSRVGPADLNGLLHRAIAPEAEGDLLAQGLPASPGAASGAVVFDADEAEAIGREGKSVILVRPETAPDDIHGIVEAQAVLTSRGGMTCHAAIVARGMGTPCVVGAESVKIDLSMRLLTVGDRTVREGEVLTVDGSTGKVYLGEVLTVEPELGDDVTTLLAWADDVRRLGVRANADTPEDAKLARQLGAEGVGLCRTEHMFMATDRLPVVREMIMSETREERENALSRLLPMQEEDFYGILRAMAPHPVTIRLLDPPLHEFLPRIGELEVEVAVLREKKAEHTDDFREASALLRRAKGLQEANPMLGFRGCRLGIVYPEIYEMQCRAIFRASGRLVGEGVEVHPEVMIPLVGTREEIRIMSELVTRIHQEVAAETGVEVPLSIGTMIEVPRAALVAGEIAETATFFSFGTNDLTQTTFGYSRDDAESKFLPTYVDGGILPENPFAQLDTAGVGRLIRLATQEGRAVRPHLKVGICGEHGGDPASIAFCDEAGLDYVSCSPYRVPIARLAAAQARLGKELAEAGR